MMIDTTSKVFLLFGNQLFAPRYLPVGRDVTVVMIEDDEQCRRYAYHRQKLALVLAAMRSHAQALRQAGYRVEYHRLEDPMPGCGGWRGALAMLAERSPFGTLAHFEVENPDLSAALARFAAARGLRLERHRSPMFINTLEDFAAHLAEHGTPKLLPYYRAQRLRHDILLTRDREPVGGRWSFDMDNRAKLPKDLTPARPELPAPTAELRAVIELVGERFASHPGNLQRFWLPTTHQQAEAWLDDFLEQRFRDFGAYEDALTRRSTFVYHSGLAPLLNIGLLTPAHVLERALEHAGRHDVPINSLEGFVRQILGWREFVRGVFHHYYRPMQSRNIWNADRKLTEDWYRGTTGIAPLDHVIRKTLDLGWAHHIERLMVAANLMNLAGIEPQEVYRWFMEMFVDAYDWVMVPNVFGMGLTSEGGIFTTKPYICGSNYVMKMGDFKRGDWCDVMDGLLWRFVAHHEHTLKANQRLAPMVANLPRVARRRPEIFTLADAFIEHHTRAA
jgi:deoxyribodipyrimidine photolyase-related protein